MTSELIRPARMAIAIAITGCLGLVAPAWAQAVHKAEVAGANASPAQIAAGRRVDVERGDHRSGRCRYRITLSERRGDRDEELPGSQAARRPSGKDRDRSGR